MNQRKYLSADFSRGYPVGEKIMYECLSCGAAVSSLPNNAASCECRNIIVDVDAGRVAVKEAGAIRAFQVD